MLSIDSDLKFTMILCLWATHIYKTYNVLEMVTHQKKLEDKNKCQ